MPPLPPTPPQGFSIPLNQNTPPVDSVVQFVNVAGVINAIMGDGVSIPLGGGGGVPPMNLLNFTNAGVFVQVVPAGITQMVVAGSGGGGGGGAATTASFGGGGGGAGLYLRPALFTVVPGETLTITVGAGGAGGVASGGSGVAGGATDVTGSSSGNLFTAGGGGGGFAGAGGTSSGVPTGNFAFDFNATSSIGGTGGSNPIGAVGGVGALSGASPGVFGGGGSGGSRIGAPQNGSNGGAGFVRLFWLG